MTVATEEALTTIAAHADPEKARGMAAYHKVARPYLGVNLPVLNDLAAGWRRDLTVAERLDLAQALWATNVHEARITAAKLLTQARIPDDLAVWRRVLTTYEAQSIYLVGQQYGSSFDTVRPIQLIAQRTGDDLELVWQAGTLLEADNVTGPYSPVAGAAAPYHKVTPGAAKRFYKVGIRP